ncbi:UDP-3-O-(3-hydroxymyristoyl)glucosamine N-acyltransferase [Undibacterium luofuense]|uniref:UDP-3-O-(3-hydroxymyristoyl)glucosamine N-acyltransferase n=1 Tax=Undibacterium luofuense TaxID=2828733 RepID=UPI0030EDA19F
MAIRLGQLIEQLGGSLHGDPDFLVQKISPLETATPSSLAFLSNPLYRSQLATTQAGCVIVSPEMQSSVPAGSACIVSSNPYLYFAKVTQFWRQQQVAADRDALVHPSAVVHPQAVVHPTARIGPLCVVEAGARVGAHSWLKSRVTVGEQCQVGERCILHSGVVIGADGFGFAPHADGWVKIEQLGAVRIGNDVEIGANTSIDRGALADTVIEDGVKLDNQIQIGHNCHIGAHTAMAGCVGVAGSAKIGKHCTFGGAAMILGHLTIADNVHISSGSLVSRSISEPGQYTGFYPLAKNADWEKTAAIVRNLGTMREKLRQLEKITKNKE